MKVMQIMPEFGLAGAEIMCENLTIELVKKGIDVVVVSLYDYHSAITDRLEKQNIKIYYLNKKSGLDLSMIKKLYRLFKEEKPEVIHTHRYVMQYAIPAAVLARVKKRIHTVHNIATKETTEMAQKLNWIFYHYFHVTPVALSKEIQSTVIDRYHLSHQNVPVIYNGINLKKCIVKESYKINGKLRFLHIGRFSEAKNHLMLVEAFSKVHKKNPNTELVLIESGELEVEIKKKTLEIGLLDSVIFAGLKENVYPDLNAADVFILPSLYEGMPMTLIEAMGTGLPVIATNVGGIPSMIQNGENGLLININVDDLTVAMLQLMDPQIRGTIGINARKTAENIFSADVMSNQYYKAYS